MKAVVCYGNGVVKYEEVPTPPIQPHMVKVAVRAAGICGSDIPRAMAQGAHSYPIILGHEFAGVVAEVGEGVVSVSPGDHVAGVPLIPCFRCENCQKGDYALCKHYSFIGSRQPGAFAEFVLAPQQNVFKLHPQITFEQGALFEPSTVALHALRLVDYQPGGTVAILGSGTIGIFALQWAKILGARKIVVFGRDRQHLTLSQRLGATITISTLDDSFMEQALDFIGGNGFDYVFETAGSVHTMQYAFELAANKARVCFIGTPTEDLCFSPHLWEKMNRKEFLLTGSWMSYSNPFPGQEWKMTEEHFANGQLLFDEAMLFRKIPFAQAADAFHLFETPSTIKGRILLTNFHD